MIYKLRGNENKKPFVPRMGRKADFRVTTQIDRVSDPLNYIIT